MKKQWFSILGRERALAVAELAAVLSPEEAPSLEQHGGIAVGAGTGPTWGTIGGSQRSGEVLGTLDELSATAILDLIRNDLPQTGKITLGLSIYGASPKKYKHAWIDLKNTLRKSGRSARIVTASTGTSLNAAQVLHNNLTGGHQLELVIWERGHRWWVGRTTWVQDIDAYTHRDRNRPARDARVGMLPPKLAQILINLATTSRSELIYDPFCGTGVVLMEAGRMGHPVGGSDLSERMVVATQTNLTWTKQDGSDINSLPITQQDAQTVELPSTPLHIVAEGYLGQPFTAAATRTQIETERESLNQLYTTILSHFHKQTQIKSIVLALPYWHIQGRDFHLPLLDSIHKIGYTFDQFAPTSADWLTYRRAEQQVGRMIVRLIKKER